MRRLLPLLALAVLFAGCKKTTPPPPATDGGIGLDAACTSVDQSATTAGCTLALGQEVKGFIYPSGNHDWYHLKVDSIPPRALLQVTGAYTAPETPVTLQILVYQGDASGTPSSLKPLGNVSDTKPRGAPAPVNVVARISQAGDYYVLLEDDTSDNDDPTHGDADAKHQYTLSASVSSDPDLNEPNDDPASATPITLDGSGNGSATGYLATTGDLDVYAVDIPANLAPPHRSILYVGIDAPDVGNPPSQIRIAYRIDLENAPDAGPIAGGQVPSPVGEQQVATAKLVPAAGRYLVTVLPYKEHPEDPDPSGDPRLKYTVTVKLMDDLDANEPNDDPSTATDVSLALDSPTSREGRLSYIPDFDWYALHVGSSGQNTRIHYQLTWNDAAANSKRFPPAGASIADHQITLVRLQSDASSCISSCPTDPNYDNGCTRSPPQCIYSYRLQDPDTATGVENFQGTIPVPAGSGGTYYLLVDDLSNDGADDRAYTLQLEWQSETSDESGGYHDTVANAVALSPPLNGSYSADPGSAAPAQGSVSYGLLKLAKDQAPNADTIPINGSSADSTVPTIDYDSLNDADLFRLALPDTSVNFPDGGSVWQPVSWSSAWTIPAAAGQQGGQRPYDLTMTYYFCDPSENPGCDTTSGRWHQITVAYGSGPRAGWTNSDQPGWDVDQNAGRFVTRANECFCVEPRFLQAGVAYLQVSGISRTSYADANYTVNTAFGPYPQSYAGDGGSQACPVDDGGSCHFCDQTFGPCQDVDGIQIPPTP